MANGSHPPTGKAKPAGSGKSSASKPKASGKKARPKS